MGLSTVAVLWGLAFSSHATLLDPCSNSRAHTGAEQHVKEQLNSRFDCRPSIERGPRSAGAKSDVTLALKHHQ